MDKFQVHLFLNTCWISDQNISIYYVYDIQVYEMIVAQLVLNKGWL